MARHLSTIIAGVVGALEAWASAVPTPGEVSVAADRDEGLAALGETPKSWRLIVWVEGETGTEGTEEAETRVRIGLTVGRGLAATVRKELMVGRGSGPPVYDLIEGVVSKARGLWVAEQSPCRVLDYQGWEWVRFEVGVMHYVVQTNYILRRQLPAASAALVVLS